MTAIDWTRPLRVKGTHQAAVVVGIDPEKMMPVRLRIDGYRDELRCGRDGLVNCGLRVENVPAEPRVVERFGLATQITMAADGGLYRMCEFAYPTRAEAVAVRNLIADNGRCRIARIIVEELADE